MLGMLWTTESSLESVLQMKLHGGFIWKTLEWLGCIVANRGRKLVPWMILTLYGVEGSVDAARWVLWMV